MASIGGILFVLPPRSYWHRLGPPHFDNAATAAVRLYIFVQPQPECGGMPTASRWGNVDECVCVCVSLHRGRGANMSLCTGPPSLFTHKGVGLFTACKTTVVHKSPCKSVCLWCLGDSGASGSLGTHSCDTESALTGVTHAAYSRQTDRVGTCGVLWKGWRI